MSTLFVVATPIGNLRDITLRAVDVLTSVNLVAAEDTRVTRKLLNHIGSKARSISYNEHSPQSRIDEIIAQLESGDVALVSDAGTPGISDPGAQLVKRVGEAGYGTIPVPGASSVLAAVSVSGLPGDRFNFRGFLPRKGAERKDAITGAFQSTETTVFLETPHRLRATLKEMALIAPEHVVMIGRELTKLHEEIFRGTASEAEAHFLKPRGETVIVVAPSPRENTGVQDHEIVDAARAALDRGLAGRRAVDAVAGETGAARSRVYPIVLSASAQGDDDLERA